MEIKTQGVRPLGGARTHAILRRRSSVRGMVAELGHDEGTTTLPGGTTHALMQRDVACSYWQGQHERLTWVCGVLGIG